MSWPKDNSYSKAGVFRWSKVLLVLAATCICEIAIAADELWVENPSEVAFSIGNMTQGARDMGLTDEGFAEILSASLERAGLTARAPDFSRDNVLLFLDIVVEDETFYTSLDFLRKVSYRLPNGELNSEFVTVWQNYAVGAHHKNPDKVRDKVNRVIERFIARYGDVNDVSMPLRVAQAH